MQWDMGFAGIALLAGMSLAFGAVAHILMASRTTRWMWLIAAASYFVGGLFVSEVWFGWATEEDLQPNVDGLSFDEVLLLGTLLGVAAVFVTWLLTRTHQPRGHARQRTS
jgi:phosphatidylserine synthase